VNYVGKAADIYDLGYTYNGSINVITHFIRNTWLWEQVRVLGGAYGGFCTFDRMTGGLAYVSYRDPNLMQTIKTFDATAEYLRTLSLHEDERIKSIIGAIGAIDAHLLPDAKGYISLQRHLIGYTETERQKIRDEVLATTAQDFSAFADVLQEVASRGIVTVLGADKSIQDANDKHGDFLAVTKVM
ncbi:MAG: peptidase M16, partial [Deltaproteobacteria bacterium]|nr:peptidase M16 [Deltaproteobacteria bacterium]